MKTQKYVLIGLMSALAFGCGEKDPLKDYQSLNTAVVPYVDNTVAPDETNQLFFIDVNERSQLSFVQGVPGEVQFSTRLAFGNANEVKYDLSMEAGPASALGAQFVNTSAETKSRTWALRWNPKSDILTSTENFRKIKVRIQFLLSQQNSPYIIKQFMDTAPVVYREFEIVLNKDQSIPFIEKKDESASAVVLNPDQQTTIRFIAAGAGLPSADSLQMNLIHGPLDPSNELAQMDANIGIIDQVTREGNSLGLDKSGRTRYQYKATFDARTFIDKALVKIRKNPTLNRKYLSGELKEVEAVLYAEAMNTYNGRRSPQEMLTIKVNLSDKAGIPIIAGKESVSLMSGTQARPLFFVNTSDARSEIQVKSLQYADQIMELKNGLALLTDSGLTIQLNCSSGTPGLNQQFNCKAGKCYEVCEITADASCETPNMNISINLNVESKMGESLVAKALPYAVHVKGKNANCTPSAAVSVAQGEK